jgi:CHAT domain-containing protein/tetratricopeptide (TPR) repeat protein
LLSIALAVPGAHGVDLSTPTSARLRPRNPGTWVATQDTIRFLIDAFYFPEADSVATLHLNRVKQRNPRPGPTWVEPTLLLAEARTYRTNAIREGGLSLLEGLLRDSTLCELTPAQRAKILMLHGVALHNALKFGDAAVQILRAMEATERAVGRDHPDYTTCLAWRARHSRGGGMLARAESLYTESAACFEQYLGSDSDSLYDCLEYQASTYALMDQFSRALPLYDRVVEQQKRSLGTRAPRLAATYYRLSALYEQLGRYLDGKRVITEAIAIIEARSLESTQQAGGLWNALGAVNASLGDWEAADRAYLRSVEIDRHHYPDYPLLGFHALGNRVSTLYQLGRITEGRESNAALRALRQTAPISWPNLANLEYWRAVLALADGDLPDARVAIDSAYAVVRRGTGSDDYFDFPYVVSCDGLYHWLSGDVSSAGELGLRVEEIGRTRLQNLVGELSDAEAIAAESGRTEGLGLALSAVMFDRGDTQVRRRVLDSVIRSRMVVLDVIAARQQGWQRATDPHVAELVESLRVTRSAISRLALQSRAGQTAAYERAASKQYGLLESLRALDPDRVNWLSREAVGYSEFAAAIPVGALVVSYVRFEKRGEEPGAGKDSRLTLPSYVAFVSERGASEPRFVELGEAQSIDSLAKSWLQAAGNVRGAPTSSAASRIGNSLRQLIWDPLGLAARSASALYIVADGALAAIALQALPDASGSTLLGSLPPVSFLTAERDLVPVSRSGRHDAGALALGGADFDRPATVPALDQVARQFGDRPKPGDTQVAGAVYRSAPSGCEDLQNLMFSDLPRSGAEARVAAEASRNRRFDAVVVTGTDASEEAFKQFAPGRSLLHIASHGFYLPAKCSVPGSPHESALVRTGIALAAANRRSTADEGREDGILTAEEVSTLDLSTADCVVLSACETGVGDIVDGEGVIGLRRAFQIAGARSLVTTLWKVDDAATQAWMREFYRGLFERNADPATAAHEASKTLYRWSKQAGRGDGVPTWGAFVVSGVGRPLQEIATSEK